MEQKQFDFPRAAKLRTLERAAMSGAVKSVLKALDGFARDAAECIETLRRIGVSMGVSESTARRAIREAQTLGVLQVFGVPANGRSNLYRIQWAVVFALPDAMAKSKKETGPEYPLLTPSKSEETPVRLEGVPLSDCQGTPVKLEGVPCQVGGGTPVRLTGVSATDHTDQVTATIRRGPGMAVGGGCLDLKDKQKSGWWLWELTKQSLGDDREIDRIIAAAVAAELLEDTPLARVRLLALASKIRNDEKIKSPTGSVAWTVENGAWNYLPRDAAVRAFRKSYGREPRAEELAKIQTSTGRPRRLVE